MRKTPIALTDVPTGVMAPVSGKGPPPPKRRRRLMVGAVIVVLLAGAGAVIGVWQPFGNGRSTAGTANAVPTTTATVTRQDLSSQIPVQATLGYAGDYSVVNQASGIATSLPAVGQVVSQGQVLYQVSGNAVVLLYGNTPAYRTLSQGVSGPDVTELNADLVALGYATTAELSPTANSFSAATATALAMLEAALGETATGTLTLGQAVFVPSAIRVTAVSATLGASTNAGQTVMTATSTTRKVTVDLDAAQQSEVKVGDQVTITLPNHQTTPGVISQVGTVATTPASGSGSSGPGSSGSSGPSTATITVEVTPTDPAATGTLDQAPVQVSITTASVSNVLVVPVDALLAQSGGGYAVEVVGKKGTHQLVGVTLGLVDDAKGLIQVSGSTLSAGQRVVVPAL